MREAPLMLVAEYVMDENFGGGGGGGGSISDQTSYRNIS